MLATAAFARTSQSDSDIPRDFLFQSAKRFLLSKLGGGNGCSNDAIELEDQSAGLLRFVYRDGTFVEKKASIEVIEMSSGTSKLRVVLPSDFSGRSQLLMEKFLKFSAEEMTGKAGREFPYRPPLVLSSVKRFILNQQVRSGEKKEEVITCSNDEAGYFKFLYRDEVSRDPNASVQVIPSGERGSKLVLTMPGVSSGRRIVFEEKMMKSIRDDLGGADAESSELKL